MNAESLIAYLSDPARLYQLPYEEIKSLTLEHPSSALLQYLLFLKCRQEDHEKTDEAMQKAALLLPHREVLYKLMRQDVLPAELRSEDVLELRPLSELQLEKAELESVAAASVHDEAPVSLPMVELPDTEKAASSPLDLEPLMPAPADRPAYSVDPQLIATAATLTGYTMRTALQKEHDKSRATDKKGSKSPATTHASFTSWIQQFQDEGGVVELSQLMEAKRAEETKLSYRLAQKAKKLRQQKLASRPVLPETIRKKKHTMPAVAQRSIINHHNFASETLANLLVEQEQYEAARQMYKRLALQIPEKSDYFAARIKELKERES